MAADGIIQTLRALRVMRFNPENSNDPGVITDINGIPTGFQGPGGVSPLAAGGGSTRTFRGAVASQAAMLALVTVNVGDWVERSDLSNQIFELTAAGQATLANWTAYPVGVATLAALTDIASYNLATNNTPLASALATKSATLTLVALAAGAVNITHAAHMGSNVCTVAGATTATFANAATSGAVATDMFEAQVGAAGSFTATGAITAPAGYKLTAGPGEVFTAVYNLAADAFYSTTAIVGAAAGNVSTVNGTVPVAVPAAGSDIKSKSFIIPAGSLGKNGAVHITFAAAKTGGLEAASWKVAFGVVGSASSTYAIANAANLGTGVGTFICEAWIYANGVDTTTLLATYAAGNGDVPVNYSPVAQGSFTLNHATTAFEISIGGNGGPTATTGATWIVTNAQCVILPGA